MKRFIVIMMTVAAVSLTACGDNTTELTVQKPEEVVEELNEAKSQEEAAEAVSDEIQEEIPAVETEDEVFKETESEEKESAEMPEEKSELDIIYGLEGNWEMVWREEIVDGAVYIPEGDYEEFSDQWMKAILAKAGETDPELIDSMNPLEQRFFARVVFTAAKEKYGENAKGEEVLEALGKAVKAQKLISEVY